MSNPEPSPSTKSTQLPQAKPEPTEWKFGWSPFVGIKYGPIPIGLIIALPILIAMSAR